MPADRRRLTHAPRDLLLSLPPVLVRASTLCASGPSAVPEATTDLDGSPGATCLGRCSPEAPERSRLGQASVEAAALIPVLMFVLGLLLQPACLLYTRSVMRAAAGECARILATARDEHDEADCRDFALRRLAAVPEVSVFHVGGPADWELEFAREGRQVTVTITGHLRPLPLLGMTIAQLGRREGAGTRIEVSVTEQVRADWVEGSYGSWTSMWG